MTETRYLQYLLEEIGQSVHNINTIAVALSNLHLNHHINSSLNIKWQPKNIDASSIAARRFSVRAAIVFATEMLFEYMNNISHDVMWKSINNNLDFSKELPNQDSKAKRFSEFCKSIPEIEREWFLMVELMCHWRNRIVHSGTSKAQLSSSDRQYLESKSQEIYESYHHFDVKKTLADYEANKVTLKEATTLISFLIKCCRKIDNHFIDSISKLNDDVFHESLKEDCILKSITKQQKSIKRSRQIERHIRIRLSYLPSEKIQTIVARYT